MKIPDDYEYYPAHWKHFNNFAVTPGPVPMGLHASVGIVNRFGARFRLANSFRGVNLENYSDTTRDGYTALFRLVLVWSAFELFMEVIDVKQSGLAEVLGRHGHRDLQQMIRAFDDGDKLYGFITARVNDTHKKELANYFNDDPCNATYLASSIRHIFAHGELTPSAGGVEPKVVTNVCNSLSGALMTVMNDEFAGRVERFLDSLRPPC